MLRFRSLPGRYCFAIAASILASLLYFLSGRVELDADLTYFGFNLAILITSLLCGLGPGLLATAISAFASAYLLLPPVFSIQIPSGDHAARLILFVGEGVLLSFVGQFLRDIDTAEADQPWIKCYLPALLFVSTATGLKLIAFPDLERTLPFTFFYAAISASAWAGGFGPGLAATLLSSLAARYFFLIPRYSLTVSSTVNAERVTLFVIEGILLSALSAKYPQARRLAGEAIKRMHQHAERMRRSLEDVRALRLTTPDVIWEWDVASNRMIRGTTEVERPETPAATMNLTTWLQQIHPEDRRAVAESLNFALRQGREEWLCEYRKLRPGGASVHILERAYIIRNRAGTPVRVVGRSVDVSENKRVSRIMGAEQRYRVAFEQNPLAILLLDNGLHVISANRAAADVLGYSSADLLGMHVEKLFQEERRRALMETLLDLTRTDRYSIALEEACVRHDGEIFQAEINAAVVSELELGSVGWVIMIEETAI
jgi:PAS domain S-box-containing protein